MLAVHALDLVVDLGQFRQPLGLLAHLPHRVAVVAGDGFEQRSQHSVGGQPALGDLCGPREPQPLRCEQGTALLTQLPQPGLALRGVGNQRGGDQQGPAEGPVGDGGRHLPESVREPGHERFELSACRVVAGDQCYTQQGGQQEMLTALGFLARISAEFLEQVRRQPGALAVTGGEQYGGTGQAERRHL